MNYGDIALTGSAFITLVVILFRTYLLNEREWSTLLDRYQADIANRDATISAKDAVIAARDAEVVALRVALDLCRQGIRN